MSQLIIATFPNPRPAELAAQELLDSGYRAEHLHIIAGDRHARSYQEQEAEAGGTEAATMGALALTGLGTLVISGVGFVLAAIPATAMALNMPNEAELDPSGQLLAALRRARLPEEDLERYASEIQQGFTLMTVAADDSGVSSIADTLRRNGGGGLTYLPQR